MAEQRRSERVLDEPEEIGRPFVNPGEEGASGDALDPLEQALEEARTRGYREGRERGEQELSRENESFRTETSAALKRLAALQETLTRQHEMQLLEIAVEAASRIVRERVEQGDPVASRALKEALETLRVGDTVRARLHPEDVEGVAELVREEIDAGKVELIADPDISRGGTVVESQTGTLDVTIETAERAAREAITGTGETSE